MGPPAQSQQQANVGDFFKRFSTSDLIIGGASLVLLIVILFFPWMGVSFDCRGNALCEASVGSVSFTGLHGWGVLCFVVLLITIAFWVLRSEWVRDSVPIPALPLPDWQIYIGLGALEVITILLFWLEYKDGADLKFGWFLALLAGIGTIVGGYMKQNEPQPVAAAPGGGSTGYRPPPPPPTTPTYTPPTAPPPGPPPGPQSMGS
jgi:hypothetical protein